jgi:hypothetical protein
MKLENSIHFQKRRIEPKYGHLKFNISKLVAIPHSFLISASQKENKYCIFNQIRQNNLYQFAG